MTETSSRKPLHRRTIDHQTWLHEEGCLEIQSRLVDTKGYDTQVGLGRALPAGEPLHEMFIRLLLDVDGVIREIDVRMASTPFDICPEVAQRFDALVGVSIGRGWNALLSERFKGVGGCRHLIDLLRGMGTVAFQSHSNRGWSPEAVEAFSGSCYAFDEEGPLMERLRSMVAESDDNNAR